MKYSLLNFSRFFAAIVIVLHHFAVDFSPFNEGIVGRFVENAHLMVNFFFVLSGYVMMMAYSDVDFSKRKKRILYWKKRAVRILPGYYIAFALSIVFFLSISVSFDSREVFYHLLGIQAWQLDGLPQLNTPSWSLSVEFLFYFLFPFIVPVIKKLKLKQTFIIALFVWVLCEVVFKFLLGFAFPNTNFTLFPLYHLPSFLLGITAFTLYREKNQRFSKLKSFTLLLIILFFGIFMVSLSYFNGNHSTLLAPLFALIIIALVTYEKNYISKGSAKLILLGDISYSIYIFHWPLYGVFGAFLSHFMEIKSIGLMAFLVYLGLLILFSLGFHLLVEKPIKDSYSIKNKAI